jgi:hypothetical protein
MHIEKKKKSYKRKARYSSKFFVAAKLTTPEVQLLQKRHLHEGNSAQVPSSPDHSEGFRSIVNQKISYGCEQESQDLI